MCLVSKEQIEELYIKQGLSKAETAKRLGIGNTTLWNYCNKYGIRNTSFWTDEEIDYIEKNFGLYPLKTLSKKLNRTQGAIKEKCSKLGITSALNNTGFLSTNDLAKALGLNRKTIWNFIKYKELPAKKQIVLNNGEYWRIKIEDFWSWLEKNEDLIDLSKLEKNILGKEPEWVDRKRKNDIRNKNRRNKTWSDFEINYLKANYKSKSSKEIAKVLNRSETSIQVKAQKLRLIKMIGIRWKDVEIDTLIKMKKEGYTDVKIAEELGRSLASVDWKRKELLKNGVLDFKYRKAARGKNEPRRVER